MTDKVNQKQGGELSHYERLYRREGPGVGKLYC